MEVARLFFGLPLPDEARAALGAWQAAQASQRHWTRPEGLHLTLAFLGMRPRARLSALTPMGEAVAGRHLAFRLRTTDLGGFPGPEAARVLWLGLTPSAALEALTTDLRTTLDQAGEAFDAKPFRPHLTLARLRPPRPVPAFLAPPPLNLVMDQLALFESGPQGCYTPLQAWPLRRV